MAWQPLIRRISGINSRSDRVLPCLCPIKVIDYKVSTRPYRCTLVSRRTGKTSSVTDVWRSERSN